ncbi:MAG: hypothetical protein AAF798_11380 [Bacteroidota bacterium]
MKINLRYLVVALSVLSVPLFFSGCADDDDPTLNEQIQGIWAVFNWVEDGAVVDFTAYESITLDFDETGANEGIYTLTLDGVDDADSGSLSSTYTLDEAEQRINFSAVPDGSPLADIAATISLGEGILLINSVVDGSSEGVLIQAQR